MLTESQVERLIDMCKSSNSSDFMLAMSIVAQYYPRFDWWSSDLIDRLGVGLRCVFWGDQIGMLHQAPSWEFIELYMKEYNFWYTKFI